MRMHADLDIMRFGCSYYMVAAVSRALGYVQPTSAPPPKHLTSQSVPDEWPCWRRRFEQFRNASGLSSDKDNVRQVSTLLYCLGEGAEGCLDLNGHNPAGKGEV